MRNFFAAAAGLFVSSLFLVSVSSAQDVAYLKVTPTSSAYTLLTSDNFVETKEPKTTIDANLKLQKSFQKFFKTANSVNWYNVRKDYLAEFDNNGRKTRALFGKNGYMYYAIAYGNEESLSEDDYRSIRSMYFDFDIVNVVEINSRAVDYKTWLVLLKNKKNTVIARVIDGGVDEYARFYNEPQRKKQRKGHIVIPNSK